MTDWLWMGGKLTPDIVEALRQRGVTHLLSVAEDQNDVPLAAPQGMQTLHIPWPDDSEAPTHRPLLDFLTALGWVLSGDRELALAPGTRKLVVYVHCDSGKHRSALMASFLHAVLDGLKAKDAYRQVKAAHPRSQVWSVKHYRHSLKKAVRLGRRFLNGEQPMGPLGQHALHAQALREEELYADDARALQADDDDDSDEPEVEGTEDAADGDWNGDRAPLSSLAPAPPNDKVHGGEWDVTRGMLPQHPPENATNPFNPFDANFLLDWIALGTHIKGGDEQDDQQYGDNGDAFVLWLAQQGVTHILNVAAEHDDREEAGKRSLATFKLWWPDDNGLPPQYMYQPPLQDFVAALVYVIRENTRYTTAGRRIGLYVHCTGGHHRSPLLAAFLIAVLGGMSVQTAVRLVYLRRKVVKLTSTPGYMDTLLAAVRAVRPYVAPSAPLNALPALEKLLAALPPVRQGLPDGFFFGIGDDANTTYFRAPDGTIYNADSGEVVSGGQTVSTEERVDGTDAVPAPPTPPASMPEEQDDPELRGSILAAYSCTPLDEQTLTAATYGAMRTAFLGRWSELGREGVALPAQAREQLYMRAQDAARSWTRAHNRGVARIATEAAQRYLRAVGEQHLPLDASLRDAMQNAVGKWIMEQRATATARHAAHQTSVAAQMADLFAGHREARYRVVQGEPDPGQPPERGPGCPGCRSYSGRDLSRQDAWHFLTSIYHPGCTHRVQLLLHAVSK